MAIPVLQALDQAKTQSYHFKTIIIAGLGFFTDAYDLYVIGILSKLLGRIYYYDSSYISNSKHNPGTLPININAAVIGVAFCGTLVGQLFFGWAGDKYGRKNVYGLTLVLMVIASIGQGLSFGNSSASVIATLCFFRFWLGFGIGGDYPLSATIMAEYSNKKTRGAFVAAVFAMQGVGYLAAGTVTIVVTAIFMNNNPRPPFGDPSIASNPNYSTPQAADWVWRIVLMFGAIPALLTFYSRSQMPETARYTALIEKDQAQAALDMERVLESQISGVEFPTAAKTRAKSHDFGLFTRQFARRHGVQLFGTCMTWFLLDISYYSQQLFQNNVLAAANWVPKPPYMSALEETFRIAKWQTLLGLFSTLPGYWFTVVLVDRVGRKPIALIGFFFMSVFMYVLAFGWYTYIDGSHNWDFIILYGLTFFFSNFGPNATTFIIPAELYPARLRSTCHGISAAAGKAGAIVGGFGFLYASQDAHNNKHPLNKYVYPPGIGFKHSFILLASCSAVGFIIQLLCVPETMGRSLEDLSGEDADNAIADEENKSQEAL